MAWLCQLDSGQCYIVSDSFTSAVPVSTDDAAVIIDAGVSALNVSDELLQLIPVNPRT